MRVRVHYIILVLYIHLCDLSLYLQTDLFEFLDFFSDLDRIKIYLYYWHICISCPESSIFDEYDDCGCSSTKKKKDRKLIVKYSIITFKKKENNVTQTQVTCICKALHGNRTNFFRRRTIYRSCRNCTIFI